MTAARDPLREAFEAWAIAHGVQLTLDIGGTEYHYPIAKGAWSAWQAATRRASAREAAFVEELTTIQWCYENSYGDFCCPSCCAEREKGHDDGCTLAGLIAAAAPEEKG